MNEPSFLIILLCKKCEKDNILSEMIGSERMFENMEARTQSRDYTCKCGNEVIVVLEERKRIE